MPDTARRAAPRPGGGRHRRPPRPRPHRGVDALARAGAVVTLASLLVLGLAVAGAVDGVGSARPTAPTVTVTIAGR